MAVFLVTWDLNQKKQGYEAARKEFIDRLDKFTAFTKDPGLDSVRFISTAWGAKEIADYLHKPLDSSDTLLVVRLHKDNSERYGWLNAATWAWFSTQE